jgi:hypothetical protein
MNFLNYLKNISRIKRKIPFNEQYETKDFILKLNEPNGIFMIFPIMKYSTNYVNRNKIPFNEQYETKDFKK